MKNKIDKKHCYLQFCSTRLHVFLSFKIGDGTNCDSSHFANMRIIFNLAFCGSVAGNRFQIDCKEECQVFDSCDDYIKSNPEKLNEAYWKIRGVYVYQRAWLRNWGADS